jgi:hypothetical protein
MLQVLSARKFGMQSLQHSQTCMLCIQAAWAVCADFQALESTTQAASPEVAQQKVPTKKPGAEDDGPVSTCMAALLQTTLRPPFVIQTKKRCACLQSCCCQQKLFLKMSGVFYQMSGM